MTRTVLLMVLLAMPPLAQTRELDVQSGGGWVDTGVDLTAGDTITVSATGQLQYPDARQANGPEGLPRTFMDVMRNLPLNEAGRGTLMGRIGDNAAARPFLIGALCANRAPVAGRLFVAINETSIDHASGSYHVKMERSRGPGHGGGEGGEPSSIFAKPDRLDSAAGERSERQRRATG